MCGGDTSSSAVHYVEYTRLTPPGTIGLHIKEATLNAKRHREERSKQAGANFALASQVRFL